MTLSAVRDKLHKVFGGNVEKWLWLSAAAAKFGMVGSSKHPSRCCGWIVAGWGFGYAATVYPDRVNYWKCPCLLQCV